MVKLIDPRTELVRQVHAELAKEPRDEAEIERLRDLIRQMRSPMPFGNLAAVANEQPAQQVCVHRGQPKARVKVQCAGCGGKRMEIEHLSFECEIHRRCLPYFRGPWGEAQQEFEAKAYHLCHGCGEKEFPGAP